MRWHPMTGNGSQKGRDRLLAELLAGASVREAARQAGVSERTAWRRVADPNFDAELTRLPSEMLRRLSARLTSLAMIAAEVLVEICTDVSKNPAARVSAARALLAEDRARVESLTLSERMSAIENSLAAL